MVTGNLGRSGQLRLNVSSYGGPVIFTKEEVEVVVWKKLDRIGWVGLEPGRGVRAGGRNGSRCRHRGRKKGR